MITETLFASSLAGIIIMISSKLLEERFGRFHYWSKVFSWGDQKVHFVMAFIVGKYQLYKKIATLFFFEFLPALLYRKLVEMKDYVYKKYYSSSTNLRGEKRMLRTDGTVSDFLQNITKEGNHITSSSQGSIVQNLK
jgi:hypothetical protein